MIYTIVDKVVERHPNPFKTALLKKNPQSFTQELGKRSNQPWKSFQFPGELNGFEDLVTLFTVGRFNRSIIRMDLDEAALLYKTVRSLAPSHGLEIGRAFGGSTVLLAVAVGAGGEFTSIDLNPSHDETVVRVLRDAGLLDRVHLVVGDSTSTHIGNAQLDWAFIDGGHAYEIARADHGRWGRLVRAGGCLIYHDATCARPGATACEQLLRLRDEILTFQGDMFEKWREAGSLIVFLRTHAAWKPLRSVANSAEVKHYVLDSSPGA